MHKRIESFLIVLLLCNASVFAQAKKDGPAVDEQGLIAALYSTAANDKAPLLARSTAIDALGKYTSKDAKITQQQKQYLQRFLQNGAYLEKLQSADDSVFLMIHVVQALGNIGAAASDALGDIARVSGHEANLNAAVEATIAAILKPDDSTTKTPSKGMKDYLTDLGNLKDVNARLVAAKSLGQYIDPTILQPLANAQLTDSDADVRVVAGNAYTKVKSVIELNQKQYVTSLVVMLDGKNDVNVRMMAAKTLGTLGKAAAPAVDTLKKMRDDPATDADLKMIVSNALRRIE